MKNLVLQSKNTDIRERIQAIAQKSKYGFSLRCTDNQAEFYRLCAEDATSVAIRDLSELEVQEGLKYLSQAELTAEEIYVPVILLLSPALLDALWESEFTPHVSEDVLTVPFLDSELAFRIEKNLDPEATRLEPAVKSEYFREMVTSSLSGEKESFLDSIQYRAGCCFIGYHFENEKLLYTNVIYDLLGCNPGEFQLNFELLQRYIHPEDWEELASAVEDMKETGSLDIIFRYYRKNGELRYARLFAEVKILEGFKHALGMVQDITDTKRVENTLSELLQQSKYFKEVVEQTADGIVIYDDKGYIQYVNPAFEQITGYAKKEVLGNRPFFWLQKSKLEKVDKKKILGRLFRGEKWQGHVQGMKKDKTPIEIDLSVAPVFSKKGEISNFVSVTRDMTEKLSLEHQLRQAQKMEAVGTLAGGIAHDFNNILMAIIGYSEMMMRRLESNTALYKYSESIMNAGNRGKRLVQQILSFSRQSGGEIRPLQVEPLIKEDIKLLQATLPSNINLTTQIEGDFDQVKADPSDLHQLVMNLSTNAIHSMEENGGDLFLKLEELELGANNRKEDLQPGKYLHFLVRDTGEGIDDSTLERIFDPFYTTRGPDKGTGLGLSVVHGIVNKLGGSIKVDSQPGQGSSFSVYLPVAKPLTERSEKDLEDSDAVSKGKGRILFVDDEKDILAWGKETLQTLGYDVVGSESSIRAWDIFSNNPDTFELVVTDQKMPDMNGLELASRIKELRPQVPILLSTGYGEELVSSEKEVEIVEQILEKPFSMGRFSQAVKSLIGKSY